MHLRTPILAALLVATPAFAAGPMPGHEGHDHHHHAMELAVDGAPAEVARSTSRYTLPHVSMVRQDGSRADFAQDVDDGRPVFLNFIYTSCTAICPPMTQTFATLQRKLGAERDRVRMVSVSIDPEEDTPARLAEYAAKFGAGAQWTFYTGTVEASAAVQKAFAAYRGDKMSHTPLTLVRLPRTTEWVRLDGFVTAEQLLQEYRRAVAR